MNLPEPRPRQPFTGVMLAAIVGIVLADRWPVRIEVFAVSSLAACLLMLWKPRTCGCWLVAALSFASLHSFAFHESPSRALSEKFAGGPRVVHGSGVVWSEPEKPQFWSRSISCFFKVKLESLEADENVAVSDTVVNVTWSGPPPVYGDRIVFTASARNLQPARNPGQFDFTKYLHRQGIYSEFTVSYPQDGRVIAHYAGSTVQAFAFAAQHWITDKLELDLHDSPELAALIESMVLGLRGDTPADAKVMFQRTGTMHLFAVSGLNVAMLAAIILQLLRTVRITGGAAVAITLPILGFYAVVTGLSASCVRATVMGALILLAPVFDRRAVVFNSIFASAFVVLAFDTNQLFLPGFQFSYVLVLVIIFLAARIQLWFEPFGAPDPFLPRPLWSRWQMARDRVWHLISETLGVSLSAWVGSLLFTAGYFHLFSPCSIAANFLAVPVSFFILALGVATLVVAGFWQAAAILFNNANWFAAKLLLAVVRVFAEVPGGHIYVEVPRLAEPACEINVLDLGDGGGIHVRSQSHDWMLDCGSTHTYDHIVLPYLRTRGVNRLDGLLLSHGDTHHIGGALSALDDLHPRCIVESALRDHSATRKHLHAELSRRSLGKRIVSPGDVLHLSTVANCRILFPPPGYLRTLADDKALVVQVESCGAKILLMSDSGFATEQWLLEHETDLHCDVLIKGQHSKDLSGTADFLARVRPQAVICSQLELGRPVEPLDEWESAAAAMGITVFRQDHTGAVNVTISKTGEIAVQAFASPQTFRSRAR